MRYLNQDTKIDKQCTWDQVSLENVKWEGTMVGRSPIKEISKLSSVKDAHRNNTRSTLYSSLETYQKKFIPQIRDQISKNPGNGKTISIWDDRIMGATPLNCGVLERYVLMNNLVVF